MRRTLTRALVISSALTLFLPSVAVAHWTPGDPVHLRRHAVNLNWCGGTERYCTAGEQAWRISGCEAGEQRSPWAHNGQFLGAFQMGSWARSRYGHAYNIWGQAKAAARYWRDAGWSPWACAYILGIR